MKHGSLNCSHPNAAGEGCRVDADRGNYDSPTAILQSRRTTLPPLGGPERALGISGLKSPGAGTIQPSAVPVHQSVFLCNCEEGGGALHPAPHGLRVMVSHFQLPPHPPRLLPVQKERRPGHTEARAELRGIQTAWEASLSQHRPLASHTSAETGWNRQAGRSLCRRRLGRNVRFPSRVPYLPACYFPELRRESEGFTPGKGTCRHTLHSSDPA